MIGFKENAAVERQSRGNGPTLIANGPREEDFKTISCPIGFKLKPSLGDRSVVPVQVEAHHSGPLSDEARLLGGSDLVAQLVGFIEQVPGAKSGTGRHGERHHQQIIFKTLPLIP